MRIDLDSGVRTILRQTQQPDSLDGYLSLPRSVEFPTTDGVAYGIFYPPKNADFAAPEGEKPPLIVMIHGGPTSVSDERVQPEHPVLDEPRLCGTGCQLRRQHRLRSRLPATTGRSLGHRRRGRLLRRRTLPG